MKNGKLFGNNLNNIYYNFSFIYLFISFLNLIINID